MIWISVKGKHIRPRPALEISISKCSMIFTCMFLLLVAMLAAE